MDIYQYVLTMVMSKKVSEELRKESLDDYKMGLLGELKEWLWRKRVQARAEMAKPTPSTIPTST